MNTTFIRIKGLELSARVGVYESEKEHPQRLIADLKMKILLPDDFYESLEKTVDYEKVASLCTEIINRQHFDLIETIAVVLARSCLESFPILSIKVTIKKPSALKNAQYCSVSHEIKR